MSEMFSRAWAMPSKETFSIKPIANLLGLRLPACGAIADPFARDSMLATHRNDIDIGTKAIDHMDAEDWCLRLEPWSMDAVLFDPPYSQRQIAEVYSGIGWDGHGAAFYKRVRNALDVALRPGGLAISFGWNSSGFGKTRGYKRLETLIVCHGGAHNDTIVTVERKPFSTPPRAGQKED